MILVDQQTYHKFIKNNKQNTTYQMPEFSSYQSIEKINRKGDYPIIDIFTFQEWQLSVK